MVRLWKNRKKHDLRQLSATRSVRNVRVDSRYASAFRATESLCEGRSDLDSHADTCVVGPSYAIIDRGRGETCDVYPYSDAYAPVKNVPIVKAGTAYDHTNGETVILVACQALYMEKQFPSLLCPNQMRANGVVVEDTPGHLSKGTSSHSIYFPEGDLRIPLRMDGVISFIPTRTPTETELSNCRHVFMTGEDIPWNPYSEDFAKDERIMARRNDENAPEMGIPNRQIFALTRKSGTAAVLSQVSHNLVDEDFVIGLTETVRVSATKSTKRHPDVEAHDLARKWGLGLETAQRTIEVTTQRGIRHAVHPIHRRYRTNQEQYRYNRLSTKMYSDTMFSTTKSLQGNHCAQIFVNNLNYSKFIPMTSKSMAGHALSECFEDVGVPTELHTDGAKELTMGHWKRVREKQGGIRQTVSEPLSQWQNRAESEIKEIKKQVGRTMSRTKASKRLWDYCGVYVSETRSRTAHPLYDLKGRTPIEHVTGDTPDIAEWLEYQWYAPVWYHEGPSQFPEVKGQIGRWLGVAHRVGQAMCYWVLPASGIPISRTTVQPLKKEELLEPEVIARLQRYDAAIALKLEGPNPVTGEGLATMFDLDPEESDDVDPFEPEAAMPEADDYDEETYDKYISAQVMLPKGDTYQSAQVRQRKRTSQGDPIGKSNSNPILDTRVYEVEFPDGATQELTANIIAEALYSQVDSEGKQFLLMEEITDHRKDATAVGIDDGYTARQGSNRQRRRTTKGWQLLVQWKDGTTSWASLADLKESNPVQLAEYAVVNKIAEEPAFAWWIHDVLRRRDRIIAKVKTRYWRRTHKFGIEVPKSVKEALQMDAASGTDLWRKAIELEMKNVMPAFKFLEDAERVPIGYQRINCHMIFDIKMDFTRKARFVAGGHMTEPPASLTYSSVVSRESVRIAFTVAALNDVDVLMADVGNAYLNATCREKIWTTAGPEFGSKEGRRMLIVRALYGIKSSGAAWRAHLAQSMEDLGFKECEADPDVWMRKAVKPDGTKYWEYVLIYVDDILAVSHQAPAIMDSLASLYRLKEDPSTKKKYGKPDRYLGANVGEFQIPGATTAKKHWYMSADSYVKAAVTNVETELDKVGKKLSTKVATPLSSGYRPELDVTPVLDDEKANYYQNLIGVLRWSVELGRIDIHVQIAQMSTHLAQPRVGHLEEVFHIFAYLKKHGRSKMVFDDSMIDWRGKFKKVDWSDFYKDAIEPISSRTPEARGKEVQLNCFVDADHAGNTVTRRSQTGVLIFLNRAPLLWFSKKQNTVETSTFGSEFVAMKIAVELLQGIRYKLRMMGIPMDGPANMFCDNEAVVTNTTAPESTLKKKHVAICYHRVREANAMGMVRIAKEGTHTNLADILTKNLPGPKHSELIQKILY